VFGDFLIEFDVLEHEFHASPLFQHIFKYHPFREPPFLNLHHIFEVQLFQQLSALCMPFFLCPLRSGVLPQRGDRVRSGKGPAQQNGDGSGTWLAGMSGERGGGWGRSRGWTRKISKLTVMRLFIQANSYIILSTCFSSHHRAAI
jgi:hypothetical protein